MFCKKWRTERPTQPDFPGSLGLLALDLIVGSDFGQLVGFKRLWGFERRHGRSWKTSNKAGQSGGHTTAGTCTLLSLPKFVRKSLSLFPRHRPCIKWPTRLVVMGVDQGYW